jgi:hypothetical protein
MSKREKHEKKPHIVREEPTSAEVAQDVASGEAPIDSEPPKFGLAWLGAPRAVPTLPDGVETAGDAVRYVHAKIRAADDGALEVAVAEVQRRDDARANYAATLAEIDRRTGRVACTTCGNPVAPGATCAVDGQIAPRG